jgi:hypothetical protein
VSYQWLHPGLHSAGVFSEVGITPAVGVVAVSDVVSGVIAVAK